MSFNFPRVLLTVVALASVVLFAMWVYVVFIQR